MKIKTGDTVVVVSGTSASNDTHKVLRAFRKANRVIVEGANIITRHTKAKKMGENGGRIEKEAPIDASNVLRVCSKCGKGVRTGVKVLEDGSKVRYCKKCQQEFND